MNLRANIYIHVRHSYERMSKQTTNDHSLSLMTSTFILSGKKLIYVSRGLLILYLMLSHMLILTPCHIARR